jgi:transposase
VCIYFVFSFASNPCHLSTGVVIEFLPPYSPDFNLIKEAFSKFKSWIRPNHNYFAATTGHGLMYDLYDTLQIITLHDAMGYFIHAGYF